MVVEKLGLNHRTGGIRFVSYKLVVFLGMLKLEKILRHVGCGFFSNHFFFLEDDGIFLSFVKVASFFFF